MTLKGWIAVSDRDLLGETERGVAGRCYEVSVSLFGISLNRRA